MARDEWLEAFEHLVDGSIDVATVELEGTPDEDVESLKLYRDSCRSALEQYAAQVSLKDQESLHPIERRILNKVRAVIMEWKGAPSGNRTRPN